MRLSVEIDGWTMMPIAENGATTHIIAARNDDEALSTDIDVVLYEKTTDGWSGTAYDPSVTKEDAMIDLADEFGLSDPFGGEWHIDLDAEDVLDFVLPRVEFGKGFFVTDPLYLIANQIDDPEPLAKAAESAGIAAGSGAVNTGSASSGPGGSDVGDPIGGDCGCDACIQNGMDFLVTQYLNDPTKSVEELADDFEASILCFCWSSITVSSVPSAWSAWACGAWGSGSYDSVTGLCTFTTNSSRIRSRTMTKACRSCITGNTLLVWTQFQTESGPVTVVNPSNSDGTCNQPTACPAPLGTTPGAWGPPGPACPLP